MADSARRYAPGEPVKLSLLVSDEHGSPSPGVLGVAVVDDALLKLADDQTPSMPTHFLLTTEVEKPEDLEKADFYLSDETKAPAALDLLLGTQGWRRFLENALEKPQEEKPVKASGDNMTRLAALGGAVPPPAVFDNSSEVLRRYNSDLAAQTVEMRVFRAGGRAGPLGWLGIAPCHRSIGRAAMGRRGEVLAIGFGRRYCLFGHRNLLG